MVAMAEALLCCQLEIVQTQSFSLAQRAKILDRIRENITEESNRATSTLNEYWVSNSNVEDRLAKVYIS